MSSTPDTPAIPHPPHGPAPHPHGPDAGSVVGEDRLPGEPSEESPEALLPEVRNYLIGLVLAVALTVGAFWALHANAIYGPAIIMAIVVLAFAQMGVHLVFFLHLTSAPDNANTALAIAFGALMAGLIIFGSVWVMYHLNHNMMPALQMMQEQGGAL